MVRSIEFSWSASRNQRVSFVSISISSLIEGLNLSQPSMLKYSSRNNYLASLTFSVTLSTFKIAGT